MQTTSGEETFEESFREVTALTVYDEHAIPVDSFDGINGPFIGLSESGKALALWGTTNYDMGLNEFVSQLHYVIGDIADRSWSAEQLLNCQQIGSLRMDMGANGDAVIAYADDEGITVLHYGVETGLDSPMRLKDISDSTLVALEVNSVGDALIVWEERDTNILVSRMYDATNRAWGADTILNVSAVGNLYRSQGHATIRLNSSRQALFVDSAIKGGGSQESLISRYYDGTRWSEIDDQGNAFDPYTSNADSVSADLTEQGSLVVAIGRRAPGVVFVATGSIEKGLGEFVEAYYESSNQGLLNLDVRWTGNSQITASFVGRNSSSTHYLRRSNDSGSLWAQGAGLHTSSDYSSAKASNSNNTLYIQDGRQCQAGVGTNLAPLFAVDHSGAITGTCNVNRMGGD